jgi:hypothetical protein
MLRFIKTHQPIFEQMLFGVKHIEHIEFTIVRHRPLLRYLFSSIITHDDTTNDVTSLRLCVTPGSGSSRRHRRVVPPPSL